MELRNIIERCQQGDREAFGLLYTASRDQLRTLCLRYVPNENVADDLLHDAFVVIITHIAQLNDPAKAMAWMQQIMRNTALLYLRNLQHYDTAPLDDVAESIAISPQPLLYDEILSMVDALPEGYQKVFRLSVFEGLTHPQIADLLGIEPHSSSSQLTRAKLLLRKWLGPLVLLLLAVVLPLGIYRLSRQDSPMTAEPHEAVADLKKPTPAPEAPTPRQQQDEPQPSMRQSKPKQETLQESEPPQEEPQQDEPQKLIAQEQKPQEQDTLNATPAPAKPHEVPDRPATTPALPSNAVRTPERSWTLALACTSTPAPSTPSLPYANSDANVDEGDNITTHHLPLKLALTLSKQLSDHWQLSTGLQYTRLTSDTYQGNTYASLHEHYKAEYLGIPISLSYHWQLMPRLTTYAALNTTLDVPLNTRLESTYLLGGQPYAPTTDHPHAPLLWSAGMSLGLHYALTPRIGLFAEPTLQHYFGSGHGRETWNTAHPFTFSIPLGLRITF